MSKRAGDHQLSRDNSQVVSQRRRALHFFSSDLTARAHILGQPTMCAIGWNGMKERMRVAEVLFPTLSEPAPTSGIPFKEDR